MKNLGTTAWAAVACIGLGFIVIMIAWNQSAGVNCIDCQIPYLLSGGAIGLAFIGLGAGLLLFEASKRDRAHIEAKLDELIDAVRGREPSATSEDDAPTAARARLQAKGSALNGMVVIGRASFHRADCRLVEGKDDLEFAPADQAIASGLAPCRVCDPTRVGR